VWLPEPGATFEHDSCWYLQCRGCRRHRALSRWDCKFPLRLRAAIAIVAAESVTAKVVMMPVPAWTMRIEPGSLAMYKLPEASSASPRG